MDSISNTHKILANLFVKSLLILFAFMAFSTKAYSANWKTWTCPPFEIRVDDITYLVINKDFYDKDQVGEPAPWWCAALMAITISRKFDPNILNKEWHDRIVGDDLVELTCGNTHSYEATAVHPTPIPTYPPTPIPTYTPTSRVSNVILAR